MPLLTQKDIDDLKAAMAELAPFTEEPIVYKKYTGMTPGDPLVGTPATPIYTLADSTAMVRDLTVEEIAVSGGKYILGDMEFSIRTATQPAYDDRIVYNGLIWKPKKINPVYLGEALWWEIKAGKE